MEFFRGKRERSVLNLRGADIKWNSPVERSVIELNRASIIQLISIEFGNQTKSNSPRRFANRTRSNVRKSNTSFIEQNQTLDQ